MHNVMLAKVFINGLDDQVETGLRRVDHTIATIRRYHKTWLVSAAKSSKKTEPLAAPQTCAFYFGTCEVPRTYGEAPGSSRRLNMKIIAVS